MKRLFALALLLATVSGCTRNRELWIYTSLYKEVIAEMDPALHTALPGVNIKWFQGGSENVAAKLNAELAAGRSKADLVLTSDPFWYLELKRNGKLLTYDSPAARPVPRELRDPDQTFVTVRIPVMVIGYNSETLKPDEAPKSWKELADARWKSKISMGSPLESGTNFTSVALLSRLFGWSFFEELRKQELVAAGGNSSVITRIETRERPVGVVLLENILKAQAKGSPVRPIYPSEGVIPVPSPIAILADSSQPEVAKKVYDWFFTPEAQASIVHGGMYSPMPGAPSPDTARPWNEVRKSMVGWSPQILNDVYAARDQVKAKFSELVLH